MLVGLSRLRRLLRPGEEPGKLRPGEPSIRMLLGRRAIQFDGPGRIAYAPLRELGGASIRFRPRMSLGDRFRDLDENRQRGAGVATPQLKPDEPPQHGEVDAPNVMAC